MEHISLKARCILCIEKIKINLAKKRQKFLNKPIFSLISCHSYNAIFEYSACYRKLRNLRQPLAMHKLLIYERHHRYLMNDNHKIVNGLFVIGLESKGYQTLRICSALLLLRQAFVLLRLELKLDRNVYMDVQSNIVMLYHYHQTHRAYTPYISIVQNHYCQDSHYFLCDVKREQ